MFRAVKSTLEKTVEGDFWMEVSVQEEFNTVSFKEGILRKEIFLGKCRIKIGLPKVKITETNILKRLSKVSKVQ